MVKLLCQLPCAICWLTVGRFIVHQSSIRRHNALHCVNLMGHLHDACRWYSNKKTFCGLLLCYVLLYLQHVVACLMLVQRSSATPLPVAAQQISAGARTSAELTDTAASSAAEVRDARPLSVCSHSSGNIDSGEAEWSFLLWFWVNQTDICSMISALIGWILLCTIVPLFVLRGCFRPSSSEIVGPIPVV